MDSVPREWGFPYMFFGAPPPGPDVRVAFPPVSDQQVQELAATIRPQLVAPLPDVPPELSAKIGRHDVLMPPALVPQISVPGHAPIHAVIERYSQTAATATWIHRMTVEVSTGQRAGQVQAVSLYLSGLDRAADNCAISTCKRMRFGPGRPLPIPDAVYEQLYKEEPPLAVQIFCQSLARVDPSIQCAFLALGTAFFGTLGVAGEEPRR